MWRCNTLFLLVLGSCCHAWAQNVAFIASAPSKMGIKDKVQVTFTIRNVENLAGLKPNGFGDFIALEGPYGSDETEVVNGVKSTSVTLTYVLKPKHEGKLTIPPAIAKDGAGHSYQSNPLTIEVVPGSVAAQQRAQRQAQMNSMFGDDDPMMQMAQQMQQFQQQAQQQMMQMQQMMQPRRGQVPMPQMQGQGIAPTQQPLNEAQLKKDLFIKVTVDKNKVHVGEQVTTSYKLYSRIPAEGNIARLPNLDGFYTQDFEIPREQKPQEEIVDGKRYQVILLKKSALFPQQTGELILDEAEVTGVARIVEQNRKIADPFGNGTLNMNDPFFNNAFFNSVQYRDIPVDLKSTPIKITVLPLPDKGKPENYGGAVGKFTIASKLDKHELTTDDVATFTLTITGSGNFKLIEAPKLNLPTGINTYDPVIIDTITGRSTIITGSKILTYAITPQTAGDYEIPAIPFTYFDPQSGTYTTLTTEPVKVHVKPGKHYNPAKVTDNTVAMKDIHDINTHNINDFTDKHKSLFSSPGYWSLYVLPVLAFIGLIVWRKKNEDIAKDNAKLRHKKANKIALQRLETAKMFLQEDNSRSFHEEISKAIWLYLSDKLHIPLSSLSRDSAITALTERKVPQLLQKQFEAVIWECETALYATGNNSQMNQTYESAVKVISDLEGII